MSKKQRKYDMEYKIQAVKLAKEIHGAKTGFPEQTGQGAGKRNPPAERRKRIS